MSILKGKIKGNEIIFDPPLDPVQWPNGQKVIIYLESDMDEHQRKIIEEAKKSDGDNVVVCGLVQRVDE